MLETIPMRHVTTVFVNIVTPNAKIITKTAHVKHFVHEIMLILDNLEYSK